jgi:hypothetical protein
VEAPTQGHTLVTGGPGASEELAADSRISPPGSPPPGEMGYGRTAKREIAWSLFMASRAATLYDSASVG